MGLRHTFGARYNLWWYGHPMIDTPSAWDQFMAGSGFVDILARYHAPVIATVVPSLDLRDVGNLIFSEKNLREIQEKVPLTSSITPVLEELFAWWDEYRTGTCPTGTYRLRAHLKQVNIKRLRAQATGIGGDVYDPETDLLPGESLIIPRSPPTTPTDAEDFDMVRVLTIEDLDGSKVPPPPTLEEVSEVCWGHMTGREAMDHYNLLVQEKKERMLRGEMEDGMGEDAGIDGWKKYVTKTIQP